MHIASGTSFLVHRIQTPQERTTDGPHTYGRFRCSWNAGMSTGSPGVYASDAFFPFRLGSFKSLPLTQLPDVVAAMDIKKGKY